MTVDTPDAGAPLQRPIKWKKGLVRVLLSAIVLAIIFRAFSNEKIARGFAAVSFVPWILALLAFIPLHVASAAKWRTFLSLGDADLALRNAVRCHGLGLFANLCLPSMIGGDVLRAGAAMRWAKSKAAVVLGSLLDRLGDALGLGVIVLLAVGLAPRGIFGEVSPAGRALVAIALLLGGLVALPLGFKILIGIRPIRRWPRKIARLMVESLRAFRRARRKPVRALLAFASGIATQTGLCLVNAALGRTMGLDMSPWLWLALWPLAKLAAMLPLSFGGIGVREAAFAALASPFLSSDDTALLVAASLVWQTILVSGGVLGGLTWKFG